MALRDDLMAWADGARDASLERWLELLRFPSVATDPAHAADTRACAEWLKGRLESIGFQARVAETTGQPMVVAHHPGTNVGGTTPHVLYYGHYDVQPADPLELWDSPPFEPQLVEGPHGDRVIARGAVDDKGQVSTWLEALHGWNDVAGGPPIPITVFLEGEEEGGSPSLPAFLQAHADELSADLCVVSDTGSWTIDTPALTTRLRGLVYLQLDLEGPSHDLHSGMYGGAVLNPLKAMSHILSGLHDGQGRVAVPGFYDRVQSVDADVLRSWAKLGFDGQAFVRGAGLESSLGEAEMSVLERVWARPTLEINGLWGGYTGEGAKTVIPAMAHAKISCRLVADQDPKHIIDAIKTHVAKLAPEGAKLTWHGFGAEPAFAVPTDLPYTQSAIRALEAVFPNAPVQIGSGGSIPAVAAIKKYLGCDSILMGFGLDDDRVHSPNEKFERLCFDRGIKSHLLLLAELADV